jgi:hypothetical protein
MLDKREIRFGQKSKIIAQYLSTPEGRRKLAASMIQPLRTRVDYPIWVPCDVCGEKNAEIGADKGCKNCICRSVIDS